MSIYHKRACSFLPTDLCFTRCGQHGDLSNNTLMVLFQILNIWRAAKKWIAITEDALKNRIAFDNLNKADIEKGLEELVAKGCLTKKKDVYTATEILTKNLQPINMYV